VIDGLAVVDKPSGMTSHDVVSRCRRVFGQKRVGHGGTLDPDATGVLLVGLGRATRLLQFMSGLDKAYESEVVLGVRTSTLDASGDVLETWDQSAVTLDEARRAASGLTGTILQLPPMVSAVKVGGRRLHELARAGLEVEREPRQVTITNFTVDALGEVAAEPPGGGPVFKVRVECSSGTYVRVLAADLGAALGGCGYARNLRRTGVGPWTLEHARDLATLGPDDVITPSNALPWIDAVIADGEAADHVRHGRVMDRSTLGFDGDGPWRVLDRAGLLLAVYKAMPNGTAKPSVVLTPAG
jgi:tRNA pseudouridine55 synthase